MSATWRQAEPGANPIELASQVRQKNKRIQVIIGLVIGVLLLCGAPVFFISRAAANRPEPTVAPSLEPSLAVTETATLEPSLEPSQTATATDLPGIPTWTPWPTATATPLFTQTPWVITQVVTKIVSRNVQGPERVITQIITLGVVITATPGPTQTPWVVTETPGPTQTPWVITQTPAPPAATQTPWVITVVVVESPTPIPTETPALEETPTEEPTPTETPTLEVVP